MMMTKAYVKQNSGDPITAIQTLEGVDFFLPREVLRNKISEIHFMNRNFISRNVVRNDRRCHS